MRSLWRGFHNRSAADITVIVSGGIAHHPEAKNNFDQKWKALGTGMTSSHTEAPLEQGTGAMANHKTVIGP